MPNEDKAPTKTIETIKTIRLLGERPSLMVQESKYRDHPLINLIYTGDNPVVMKFGAGKAKMIIWSIDEIVAFYDRNKGKLDSGD